MINDRRPNNVDNDETIKQWARDNGKDHKPVTNIELITACKDEPNTASIHWCLVGQPVTRYFR